MEANKGSQTKNEIQSGKISVNEARIRFGLAPIPDPACDLKICSIDSQEGGASDVK